MDATGYTFQRRVSPVLFTEEAFCELGGPAIRRWVAAEHRRRADPRLWAHYREFHPRRSRRMGGK